MKYTSQIINELSELIEQTVKRHSSATNKRHYIALTIAQYMLDNKISIVEHNYEKS